MSYLSFVENKQHFLSSDSLVSHSLFFGLQSGAIIAENIILQVLQCVFEEITKEGNGACVESRNLECLRIEKCSAKASGVYARVGLANSHVFYINSNVKKKSFFLYGVSICACAPRTFGDQRSIVRASCTDSEISDLNITNSYTTHHALLARANREVKYKRIILESVETDHFFLHFEYETVTVEKMIVSNINISDDCFIYQNSNVLVFTECIFDFKSYEISAFNSSVTFDKCFFVDKTPSLSDGVTIINNITSIDFGESIINVGEIYEEINKVIKVNILFL